MSKLEKTQVLLSFNDNLFNNSSLLRNNPSISNYGAGSLAISQDYAYSSQSNSIELTSTQDVALGIVENFNIKDAFTYTVEKTGRYVLSFRIFANSITNCPSDYIVNLKAIVRVNGIDAHTFDFELNLSELKDNGYLCLAQVFNATINDDLDLRFELQSDSIGLPNPSFVLNFSGFKLELDEKLLGYPTEYTLPKTNVIGIYDYNNTIIAQLFTGTDLKINNNGLGINTNKLFKLDGINDLFNTTTNNFDFSKLELGDIVSFRIDTDITTTSVNQNIEFYLKVGVGSGSEYNISLGKRYIKGIATHSFNDIFNHIYIGNTITKDYSTELYFTSDDNATVLLNGFLVTANKKR